MELTVLTVLKLLFHLLVVQLTYSLVVHSEDDDEQADYYIINAHVVYAEGAWTLGAEYNVADHRI